MDADAIMRRLHELEEENKRLKSLLVKHGIPFEVCSHDSDIAASTIAEPIKPSIRFSLQEKVELFRSLFKGREDVFAKRWYSDTTKKSGYQPVCEREWNREFCDKRKYKCAECPNRQFAPLSYQHIYNHLAGKDALGRDVVGLYPILNNNTCFFLCTDFDDKSCEHGYQNDVLAFMGICKEWHIPCYIERSRSGNGAHVWIFFDAAITASKARRLGNLILSEAMNKDAHLSFKSSDRNDISKQELIYDGHTFSASFQQDLFVVKHSIVIFCKKIKYKYTPRLVSRLRELMANGIEVVVHVKEQGYNENELQEAGIEVLCNKEQSVQCAIIDKSIVWYGNINFFGYNAEDNNVMRINDSSIADELLNII